MTVLHPSLAVPSKMVGRRAAEVKADHHRGREKKERKKPRKEKREVGLSV
jgi:hypothetical protein